MVATIAIILSVISIMVSAYSVTMTVRSNRAARFSDAQIMDWQRCAPPTSALAVMAEAECVRRGLPMI